MPCLSLLALQMCQGVLIMTLDCDFIVTPGTPEFKPESIKAIPEVLGKPLYALGSVLVKHRERGDPASDE